MTEKILGAETPRIYTPPKRELTPETSHGFAAILFAETMMGLKLFPWQKWLLIHALELNEDGITYRFRFVIVLIARQNGKALDTETPILTTDGWSTMGDLQVGDKVYHPDGHPTEVVAAHHTMHGHRCYEVTTTDGRSIVADADHLWTVKDLRRYTRRGRAGEKPVRTYQWETLTTQQLIDRGITGSRARDFAYRLPKQEAVISKPVDLPIDPYVLGAWLGDGTSTSAEITVGNLDRDAMRSNLLNAGARIVSERPTNTAWLLRLNCGNGMRDGFESRARRLGVWGNKHVPEVYLTAGTEQRAALLAGLLDTDGSISQAGQVEFCSINEALADAALYLARSLGYRATKRVGRATLDGRDCGEKYRVFFTPSASPFRLERKSARVRPAAGDRDAISIRSIVEVPSRPVRCITVDREDGLFLAGRDLVPTHNSLVLLILALWHLFAVGSREVIATAQDLGRSEAAWKEAVEWCEEDEELSELIHNVDRGHPKLMEIAADEEIPWKRQYRVASAGRRGGRGFSGDLILMDELREHQTWETWGAVTNTMNARPKGQAWAFSNAGDNLSIVLRYVRAQAHKVLGWPDGDAEAEILGEDDPVMAEFLASTGASDKTGFFEYSAPPKSARTDLNALAQANPSMNHTDIVPNCITQEALLANLGSGTPPWQFDTEVRCIWVPMSDMGPFEEGAWEDTLNDTARPTETSSQVLCVAVSKNRSRAYIARAGWAEDGKPVVGIAAERAGTDWIIPWLQENSKTYELVVAQDKGAPVSSLLWELESAKDDEGQRLPFKKWTATDVAPATGIMADRLNRRELHHLSHPGLDAAALSAAAKILSRSAFEVDVVKSPTDAQPLQAAIGALWALEAVPPAVEPTIYEWPDDEEMASWLAEED